jgi:broad specificity phosphatase PhoE
VSGLRLLLVRHGQTAANVVHALDTRPPGSPLTELGHQQAADLADRLADQPITAVYASTATRTQQTAAPLAARLGLAVVVIDGVHEIFAGDLEDRSDEPALEVFEDVYAAWRRGELDARVPGGESARELRGRFAAAVARISAGASGAVVLVSHGGAIRLGVAALIGETAEAAYIGNTGLVVLETATDGSWRLEHWDPAPPRPGDVTAGGQADAAD